MAWHSARVGHLKGGASVASWTFAGWDTGPGEFEGLTAVEEVAAEFWGDGD